ncbi:MAG: hypothetical protein FWD55_01520 [Propionibacteriaceae bacterium]|nr:hypothetical protein [Propionibacteriaceae bacterium]
MKFIDAGTDLLFQGLCPGCHSPGRGVCCGCTTRVMMDQAKIRSRPGIDLPLWCGGDYAPPLMNIISAAKDHHRRDGIWLLSVRLAFACAGLIDERGLTGEGILVPFPSRGAAVRERGLDFTQILAAKTVGHLRRIGHRISGSSLLRHVRSVQDQSELSVSQRQGNLEGSLAAIPTSEQRWMIVIDDVVTTGASMREAVRALRSVGYAPVGLAAVAGTRLRI